MRSFNMKNNKAGNGQETYSEARACNRFQLVKAIIITYSECVFVALIIQHALRMCQIVFYDLPDSTTFFRIIS